MGYTLQAIVGHESEMRSVAPGDLPTIDLADGFGLWPIDSDYQDSHAIPFLPLTDEGLTEVPDPVADLAALLSACVYIEAVYHGGDGVQASASYQNGVQSGLVTVSDTAINEGLRGIGVVAKPPLDEFDSIGLGRERNTDAWRRTQEAEQGTPPNRA